MASRTNNPQKRLVSAVSSELESIRRGGCGPLHAQHYDFFPAACRKQLFSLPGNSSCADCGTPHPQWASVTYGALICLQCSGRHRSYGVNTSKVRSVTMDTWSHTEILAMLEGGNEQLRGFFRRHRMESDDLVMRAKRYHTKAARFYRKNLAKHVQQVANKGVYKGREAARQHYSRSPSPPTRHTATTNKTLSSKQQQPQPVVVVVKGGTTTKGPCRKAKEQRPGIVFAQ